MKDSNITMTIEEENYFFKSIITNLCVDLPAKGKIQETKQFGGYDACSNCEVSGERVILKKSGDGEGKQRKKTQEFVQCVRYVEGKEEYPLRNEMDTLKKMLLGSTKKEDVNGIKDVSCLVALEHFSIVAGVGVEYMHCVLLGVQKRILKLFLEPKNKNCQFYITPKNKKRLSDRIMSIKPNADVVRKPRSLEQIADLKATEFKFIPLYYLPVCLEGCVSKVYVEHIRLLSGAVYLLLQKSITCEEVNTAEKMLHKFVKQHQEMFGNENMVMNIHLLKHLAESVRQLGPLWCHSAFPFERNNGVLLKMVSGTTDVLLQIASKYRLKNSIGTKDRKEVTNGKDLLGNGKSIVEKSLRVFCTESLKELDLSNKVLCAYNRIKLGSVRYTSLLYTKPKKSIDYFISLKNGLIGMAKFYIELHGKIFVVLDEYETIDFINHISKVQRKNNNILSLINNIQMKYIYMKVNLQQYITSPPNPYEKE